MSVGRFHCCGRSDIRLQAMEGAGFDICRSPAHGNLSVCRTVACFSRCFFNETATTEKVGGIFGRAASRADGTRME